MPDRATEVEAVAHALKQESDAGLREDAPPVTWTMYAEAAIAALDSVRPQPEGLDHLVDRALDIFRGEYRANYPQGGDAQDHDEAQRAGIEAVVVALAQPEAGQRTREALRLLVYYADNGWDTRSGFGEALAEARAALSEERARLAAELRELKAPPEGE